MSYRRRILAQHFFHRSTVDCEHKITTKTTTKRSVQLVNYIPTFRSHMITYCEQFTGGKYYSWILTYWHSLHKLYNHFAFVFLKAMIRAMILCHKSYGTENVIWFWNDMWVEWHWKFHFHVNRFFKCIMMSMLVRWTGLWTHFECLKCFDIWHLPCRAFKEIYVFFIIFLKSHSGPCSSGFTVFCTRSVVAMCLALKFNLL